MLTRAQAPTSTTYHLRRGCASGKERAGVTASGREKNSGRRAAAERDGRRSRSNFGEVEVGWATTDVGWRKREAGAERGSRKLPLHGKERTEDLSLAKGDKRCQG